jgi:acetyl-CoA carboxylase biotin carboxyl carrier protein
VLASSAAAPSYAPPPSAPAPASSGSAAAAPAADSGNFKYIKSPMVGTYYARPNPKSEAYVKVGDVIDANTVVCIIEAMKVFNEIPAEIRGKVVEILVQDGEAVEFEKPLFKIEAK